jgi:hypothetical protein
MNTRRLSILAAHLRTVKRKQFDMCFWVSARNTTPTDCGSAGCALGHACTIPSLRRAGLKLDDTVPCFRPHGFYYPVYGYDAGKKVFDLSFEEAHYLFNPDSYDTNDPQKITPITVARRIEQFVKRGGMPQ